ncbi:unnamed protein product [Ilex paraguariensis]|uniref:Uncharacterized protein n=1 Tax=Ilex paraguariensis TaxID=185542 RepID=A0ABC8R790_9AQUA
MMNKSLFYRSLWTRSCSLICFKKHKEIPCVRPESASEAKAAPGAALHVERPYYVDEQSEVLQNLQLEATASCSEIRNALEDEELQKLIYNIDTSPDAENELDKAMETEVFRLFTDKILCTISGNSKAL